MNFIHEANCLKVGEVLDDVWIDTDTDKLYVVDHKIAYQKSSWREIELNDPSLYPITQSKNISIISFCSFSVIALPDGRHIPFLNKPSSKKLP